MSYYHFDGLGSTRLLSDTSGAITDTYDYDAFGNLLAHTGTAANDFLFTGQQYDANVGFYYLRARYYQSDTGRFTALDPFAGDPYAPATLHKYSYAANDPVNKIDPSGMMEFSLGGMMLNLSIRATTFAIRYPTAANMMMWVLSALVPAEIEMAFGPGYMGAAAGIQAIYHSNVASYAARKGQQLIDGVQLENLIAEMGIFRGALRKVGLTSEGTLAGYYNYAPSGGRIIDFLWNGSLIEIKTSAAAIDLAQAEVFIKAAKNYGYGLHYWFLRNPTGAEELRRLENLGTSLDVKIIPHYIFP